MTLPLRIAYTGATPVPGGGVPGMAQTILQELAERGAEVEVFIAVPGDTHASETEVIPAAAVHAEFMRWKWSGWYTRIPLVRFISGQASRAIAQRRLAERVVQRHHEKPFDLVYQMSQLELFGLRRHLRQLPPLVLHPEVHAAGELKWHLRERRLALVTWRWWVVFLMLATRQMIQRRDIKQADRVIAPSQVFARHLVRDYGVTVDRIDVVPNPIDNTVFQAGDLSKESRSDFLYVGRISTRKGVEMVLGLASALRSSVPGSSVRIVGGESLWSDYRHLLAGSTDVHYLGGVPRDELPVLYRSADIVIQPSHYEPFALTVGEALACGTPTVVSDEVGAGEFVGGVCCRRFPAGCAAAFEAACVELIEDLKSQGATIRRLAREDAVAAFDPAEVVSTLYGVLEATATAVVR